MQQEKYLLLQNQTKFIVFTITNSNQLIDHSGYQYYDFLVIAGGGSGGRVVGSNSDGAGGPEQWLLAMPTNTNHFLEVITQLP